MGSDPFTNFQTLESHIARRQNIHFNSRGVFSNILRRIGLASKIISAKVQKAGLLDVLGAKDVVNVQGEVQMKLDDIANEVFKSTFSWMPAVAGIASEEEENFVVFPRQEDYTGHRYIILFDPLDGSSNIDANVSVGTIFSIYRVKNSNQAGHMPELKDFLQPGRDLAAAGYVIYGSSTMFVYSTGQGVHGFTLDPEIGEYILSHENMQIPDKCKCLSMNDSNYQTWDEPTKRFADHIRFSDDERYAKSTSRYIGSLVADVHRNMLYGGIFMYPMDASTKQGKLRLLYEAAPMAYLVEQAGGKASTGTQNIIDVIPTELHQRVPLVIGNKKDVELLESMYK